ncbi:hypothetical protein [Streptomyces incanus]|uniref:Uncharacterized protein n=1 Tax=Streptomyces incanus TaxID=887453 RepID=A0ABW0XVF7_9ACTN
MYDSGYSVGFRHSTHSAYGGTPAFGGLVASIGQEPFSVRSPA